MRAVSRRVRPTSRCASSRTSRARRASRPRSGASRRKLALGMFADLFVGPATNVLVFFADVFGETATYNVPGVISESNWRLRVPGAFREVYAARLARGEAMDVIGRAGPGDARARRGLRARARRPRQGARGAGGGQAVERASAHLKRMQRAPNAPPLLRGVVCWLRWCVMLPTRCRSRGNRSARSRRALLEDDLLEVAEEVHPGLVGRRLRHWSPRTRPGRRNARGTIVPIVPVVVRVVVDTRARDSAAVRIRDDAAGTRRAGARRPGDRELAGLIATRVVDRRDGVTRDVVEHLGRRQLAAVPRAERGVERDRRAVERLLVDVVLREVLAR